MRGVLPQSRAVLRGPSALHRHLQTQFLQGILQTDQSDSAQVPDHRDAAHVVAEHKLDGMGDLIADGDTRRERQLFHVGQDDCVYFAAFHRSIRLRSCSRWKSSHSPSMAVAPDLRSGRPEALAPVPRQNCIAKEMPDACRGRHPLPAGRRKPCRHCVAPAWPLSAQTLPRPRSSARIVHAEFHRGSNCHLTGYTRHGDARL